jgi:hypothetical protein
MEYALKLLTNCTPCPQQFPASLGGVQVLHGVVHERTLLPTLLCSLQRYYISQQYHHYLRWPNLHVRCSVTLYIIFCL